MYEEMDSNRHSFGEERAIIFHQMANVYYSLGEYARALEKYQDSNNITKDKIGYELIESTTLHQMANVYYSKKEYDNALKLYKDSLKLKKQINDELGIAATLGQIRRVILFTQKDRPLEALPYTYHASLIFEKYERKDKKS